MKYSGACHSLSHKPPDIRDCFLLIVACLLPIIVPGTLSAFKNILLNQWIIENSLLIMTMVFVVTSVQANKEISQRHRFYDLHDLLWLNKKEAKVGRDTTILFFPSGIPGCSVEKINEQYLSSLCPYKPHSVVYIRKTTSSELQTWQY